MTLYNLVRCYTATLGTADIVVGAAVAGYKTFADVPNLATVSYGIQDIVDGVVLSSEVGEGTWNSATHTLARTTVRSSTNSNNKIVLVTGTAQVYLTATAEDFTGGVTAHSALTQLDYASAGHTGFQPAGSYLTAETDPVFIASPAYGFAVGDPAKLAGIQAGAQVNDISGTGVAGQVAEFVTNTKTLQAAKIIGPATNILTIINSAAKSITFPGSSNDTVAMLNTQNVFTAGQEINKADAYFQFKNTSASQFSGSGFFMYGTTASLGNNAGVYFSNAIKDASATQSFFVINRIDYQGNYQNNIITIDVNTERFGLGTSAPASKFHIHGVYGAPSLSADTNNLLYISSDVTVGLAVGCSLAAPYDVWFQGKLTGNGGVAYPLSFNPLGGAVYFNQSGDATGDIIAASDTKANMFFLDASANAIGIDQATPTAKLHLGAGSATANTAPLKFTDGTLLTSVEAGAMEYYHNSLWFTNLAVRRTVVQAQSVITADQTIANSTVETTIFTQAHGANYLQVGKCEEITIQGIVSSLNTGVPAANALTIRVKYAGATLGTFTVLKSATANRNYEIHVRITCRATGAGTTTMQVHANADVEGIATDPVFNGTSTALDSTTTQATTVTVQWSDADAGNTTTIQQGYALSIDNNA